MSRDSQVEKLLSLLPPLQDSYVLSGDPEADTGDGKVEVNYTMVREQVTPDLIRDHLNGKIRIAVCPILSDGHSSQFGVVDIDVYNISKGALQTTLDCSLPPVVAGAVHPYRTKSGGWHLFLSLTAMVEAGDLKKILGKIRSWLPYDNNNIDIRPEQARLNVSNGDRGSMGSYITLPLYNTSVPEADAWLDSFARKRITPEELSEGVSEGLFDDGPPCLFPIEMEGRLSGEWTNRNHFVYQLSVFFQKKFPSDWQKRVEDYVEENISPAMDAREVEKTIASVERNKPRYICTRGSFPRVCNKPLCSARKHGIASGDSAQTVIKGQLAVIDADPKTWFVTMTGKDGEDVRAQLTTNQLQDVRQFRKRCLEETKNLPTLPTQSEWDKYINVLLEEVTVIPVPEDMTPEAELLDHIRRFYLSASTSSEPEALLRGSIHVYNDMLNGKASTYMMFNLIDFKNYMVRGRHVSSSENLYTRMKQLEMSRMVEMHTILYNISGTALNVWKAKVPEEWVNQRELTDKGLT